MDQQEEQQSNIQHESVQHQVMQLKESNIQNELTEIQNKDEFKTPIKQLSSSSSSGANIITTPLNTTTTTTTTSLVGNTIYSTPIQNSPFAYRLTPVVENKRLFGVDSSDVLPMPNSTIVNKNVHSPPKSSFTINELRSICEKKLIAINKSMIDQIVAETKNKKKSVTQWFINEWFESNKEINVNVVLRTVFSVFCGLRKDGRLDDIIAVQFQSFWNKLKKEKHNKRSFKKKKNKNTINNNNSGGSCNSVNNSSNIDQYFDISESFLINQLELT